MTWSFDNCEETKPYVCEQTNACPAEAYPCYHQPDQKLDWCAPLKLTDSQCQYTNTESMMPFVSIGYVNYLHSIVSGPGPARSSFKTRNRSRRPRSGVVRQEGSVEAAVPVK